MPPPASIFGTSYYPELVPEAEWGRDLEVMRGAGLGCIRMLDFAWTCIEPQEGVYEWGWLDRFLALCHEKGLEVVLCTPTAAVPAWLSIQYPEVMVVNRDGSRHVHGGRRGATVCSSIYRHFSALLARALGSRYGRHPAVIGWQIDNELIGPEQPQFESHGPDDQFRFRDWLKKRYSLAEVNRRWAMRFWCQEFSDWGEVTTPREGRASQGWVVDYFRFFTDMQAEFLAVQRDALRSVVEPRQWISHNSTGVFDRAIDHRTLARELDCCGWDAYKGAAAASDLLRESYSALAHAQFRCALGKPFWIFETGPEDLDLAHVAEMRARGAERIVFWHWRRHRGNQEQNCAAFCDYDGRPYPERIARLRRLVACPAINRPLPKAMPRLPATVVYSPDTVRFEHRPSGGRRPLPGLAALGRLHHPFWVRGIECDMSWPGDGFDGRRLVILPGVKLLDDAEAEPIRRFVEGGGVLLACAPTAWMDGTGTMHRVPGAPLAGVLGFTTRDKPTGDPEQPVFTLDGVRCTSDQTVNGLHRSGAERVDPCGAEVLAVYESGTSYAGLPAVLRHAYGKGQVFYVTCQCLDAFHLLAPRVLAAAGLQGVDNPHRDVGVATGFVGGTWYFNHADAPRRVAGIEIPAHDYRWVD